MRSRPLLYLKHPVISRVVSEDYEQHGAFESPAEFKRLLENLPDEEAVSNAKAYLHTHDEAFCQNVVQSVTDLWEDTRREPSRAQEYKDKIAEGVSTKKEINTQIMPNVRLSSSYHYTRRHLLHNGYRDDITKPYTDYWHQENGRVEKAQRSLF
jgi:hypothetical protein